MHFCMWTWQQLQHEVQELQPSYSWPRSRHSGFPDKCWKCNMNAYFVILMEFCSVMPLEVSCVLSDEHLQRRLLMIYTDLFWKKKNHMSVNTDTCGDDVATSVKANASWKCSCFLRVRLRHANSSQNPETIFTWLFQQGKAPAGRPVSSQTSSVTTCPKITQWRHPIWDTAIQSFMT